MKLSELKSYLLAKINTTDVRNKDKVHEIQIKRQCQILLHVESDFHLGVEVTDVERDEVADKTWLWDHGIFTRVKYVE